MLPFSVPALWSSYRQISLSVTTLCLHLHLLLLQLSLLRSSKSPLDPPQFLRFLQGVVTKPAKPNFSLLHQEDAAEILSCIFEEFCVESLHVQHMLRYKLRYEMACNTYFDDSSNEESSSLLQLALSNSIQTSLNS